MLSGIETIATVAERLGSLRERVVFLGGAVLGLLVTDEAAPEVRVTDDVDVVLEIGSRSEYYRLGEELLRLGFTQRRQEGDPVCRWSVAGILVDVMPTDETILGFSNRWYKPAIESADRVFLPQGISIRVITAPYFLATKMEAFRQRGRNDYQGSHDIADIVSLVDGRPEIVAEADAAEPSLKQFIAGALRECRTSAVFAEAVAGHLLPDSASQQRVPLVLDRIDQLTLSA